MRFSTIHVMAGHIHRHQVIELPGADGGRPRPFIYAGSVERTSFAERDEAKGFVDLTFTVRPGQPRAGRLTRLRFRTLPARPMKDLSLDGCLTPEGLDAFLQDRARTVDPDAVVRLTAKAPLPPELAARLATPRLREIFPPTVNVTLGGRVFDRPARKARRRKGGRS